LEAVLAGDIQQPVLKQLNVSEGFTASKITEEFLQHQAPTEQSKGAIYVRFSVCAQSWFPTKQMTRMLAANANATRLKGTSEYCRWTTRSLSVLNRSHLLFAFILAVLA
jgi:uncharacterized protein involved in response to NO